MNPRLNSAEFQVIELRESVHPTVSKLNSYAWILSSSPNLSHLIFSGSDKFGVRCFQKYCHSFHSGKCEPDVGKIVILYHGRWSHNKYSCSIPSTFTSTGNHLIIIEPIIILKISLLHLCPEMHAMANLAILTKSCHSIDDDEFGEISPIFPNLNVSYANYLNTGSPMLTWRTCRANLARIRQIRQTA